MAAGVGRAANRTSSFDLDSLDEQPLVADSLSRHIAILHALGEGNFKSLLRKEQKPDSFCSPIICYLEYPATKTPCTTTRIQIGR